MRAVIFGLLASGCGAAEGEVSVAVWGEERVSAGYEGTETDGWTIRFSSWITSVGEVALLDPQSGDSVAEDPQVWAVELVGRAEPVSLHAVETPEGRWDVRFSLAPPGATWVGPDTDPAPVANMAQRGAVHRVAGTAVREGLEKRFDWYFDGAVTANLCRNGVDDTVGLSVSPGGTSDLQVTLHADHLLWDQLGTEEANLRFQALADADLNADGEVDEEELRARSTQDAGYETSGLDLPDLWSYLRFSLAQSVHLNGDGLCQIRAR
jgi:hypothetical protein